MIVSIFGTIYQALFRLLSNEGGAVHEAYSDIIGTAVEFSVHAPGAGPL